LDSEEGDGRIELDLIPNEKPTNEIKQSSKDESNLILVVFYTFFFILMAFKRRRWYN
jgi:hypothetical protein